MLIIHGTKDIIVDVENADIVKNTVRGYVEQWLVEGRNHAFIIMGKEEDAYKEHIYNFIDRCKNVDITTNVTREPEEETETNSVDTNTGLKEQSFLERLISIFK